MHVCIVSILLYIVYTVIWSNQKMSAGLRPQWEAERSTVLCVVKSQDIHVQLRRTSPQKSVKRTFCTMIYRKMYFLMILSEDILADNICAIHQRTSNTSITNLSASQNELMRNRKYILHLVSYLLRISCALDVLVLYRAGLFVVSLCLLYCLSML